MRRYSEWTASSVVGVCGLALAVALAAEAKWASAGEQPDERGIRIEESAAQRFDRAQKWAIVIGANEYLDPRIPNLKYCVADAKLVAKTLSQSCGYDPKEGILTITDDQEKAHHRPLKINLDFQIAEWRRFNYSRDGRVELSVRYRSNRDGRLKYYYPIVHLESLMGGEEEEVEAPSDPDAPEGPAPPAPPAPDVDDA